MKKNRYLMIAVFVIIAVVYNIVVFSIVKDRTTAVWSAYGFTMLAVVAAGGTYLLAFKGSMDAAFLNIPTTLVATIYYFVQLFLGIIVMLIPNLSVVFANVFQIIILAVFLIAAIGGLISKNITVDSEREVWEKVFLIKSLAAEVDGLITKASDATHKKVLTSLYEAIRYSDPMSHQSLGEIEQRIAVKVSDLADMINVGTDRGVAEQCAEVEQLVAERNRQCRLLK